MTRDEIIKAVRVKLDELYPHSSDVLVAPGGEKNPLTRYIDKIIDPITDRIRTICPPHKVSSVDTTDMEPAILLSFEVIDTNIGVTELHGSWLRSIRISIPEWEKDVYEFIGKDSPIYKLQQNKYTRAGYAKPVCVVSEEKGVKRMELYTVPATLDPSTITHFYVKSVPAESMETQLLESLIWMTAADILQIMGEDKKAQMASGKAELEMMK